MTQFLDTQKKNVIIASFFNNIFKKSVSKSLKSEWITLSMDTLKQIVNNKNYRR